MRSVMLSLVGLLASLVLLPLSAEAQQAAAPSALAVIAPVESCDALSRIDLATIGGAGSKVTGTEQTTSGGIPVCSVKALLAPSINVQILLPTKTWTQRYLQVGCGGLCGMISLQSGASNGCPVLTNGGFVMAATDMGHSGQSPDWGLDDQKRVDFAYRAQHLTALTAKALIRAFYGQEQKFAYFNGCSDGGREALMEAQRYPGDFNGVIAGAPAMLFQVQNTLYHGWQAVSNTAADGSVILTSDRLPFLHKAVVEACDTVDGVKDGLITEPAKCHFDLATITCTNAHSDTATCLTPSEANVARRFYEGPKDATTGVPLTAGQPLPGSELNWQGVYVADEKNGRFMSPMAALPVLQTLAFSEPHPNFQLADLAFTTATLDALRARHTLFDATNTNLDAFDKAGGKLILWHGLADPHIAPANTLAYHKGLIAELGARRVESFERLYLLPGVSHCGGGEALSNLDLLSAMMAWVETGAAPDAIITTSTGERTRFGQPDFGGDRAGGPPPQKALAVTPLPPMQRPVYPYPATAVYNGKGPVGDAASWQKGADAEIVSLRPWPGENFFSAYTPSVK